MFSIIETQMLSIVISNLQFRTKATVVLASEGNTGIVITTSIRHRKVEFRYMQIQFKVSNKRF